MITESQILLLSLLNKVGKKTIFKIAEDINTAYSDESFVEFILQWGSVNKFQGSINDESINIAQDQKQRIIEESSKRNIQLLGYWNEKFPSNLKHINNPPVLLHVAGNIDNLNQRKTVAIVGTREPSVFGFKSGRRLAELFTKEGFVIVSGLAKGCDTSGHLGCIDAKGRTIAVLAHGLDMIYPKENQSLALDIIHNQGTLISEYSVGQKPFSTYFVERDRLQSGLSEATIVVETDIKGGTMHTVKYTEEEHKILACISHPPEHLNYPKVNGNQFLIKSGRALPIANASDVKTLIDKIYLKLGISKDELDWTLTTLFDLDTIPLTEYKTEKVKKPRKKKTGEEVKSKDVKQILIWE